MVIKITKCDRQTDGWKGKGREEGREDARKGGRKEIYREKKE